MHLFRPLLVILFLAACSPSSPDSSGDPMPPDNRACAPAPGTTGSPNTIEEAMALINALPRPVTVPCFLESLDRPLRMSVTFGTISAQPAVGLRSPRLFLFSGDLIMSVALEGTGQPLLEFGALSSVEASRKGEIEFPVTEKLPPGAPYTRIMYNESITSCAFCHASETQVAEIGGAKVFESRALQPVRRELMEVADVRLEYEMCGDEQNMRCDMLRAIFSHGEVLDKEFPRKMLTIFD